MNARNGYACFVPRSGRWRALLLAALLAVACERATSTSQPASAPGEQRSQSADPLFVERLAQAADWTQAEAARRLADEVDAPYAALRLVQLSQVRSLLFSAEVASGMPPRVRVRRLNDAFWALGLAEGTNGANAVLRAALLLAADGTVIAPTAGLDEELSALHISNDAEVFPHLIVTPTRVLVVRDSVVDAIVARSVGGAAFRLRRRGEYPYIALEHPAAAGQPLPAAEPDGAEMEAEAAAEIDAEARARGELARYTWDPFEAMFMGPADGLLPSSVGGRFSIDLARSAMLVPVGGLIEGPLENTPPQSRPDDADWPLGPE